MAIKINFDVSNIPENPTLILATRKGDKLGKINAQNIVIKDSMTDGAEITFSVNKYINNVIDSLWNNIKDYKLVYCKEADLWFQTKVDIDELSNTVKNVSCVQLAQAELSQIMLYNVEINTENDIARDDYISPTVLYNDSDHSVSLLHRIMEKVPHYQIIYVSPTITNIQRTFTFDDTSLYDAFQNIAEEIGCLFIFHSDTDNNGNIRRGISVYDLESYCSNCGNRGRFINTCPKCNGTNILEGYGEDTTIFITADELGNDIKFTSDTDSQKNCFKLEAGDELMTATVRNCNPNGTDYIWYIPDYIKEDMSTALVSKLNDYDTLYDTYNTTYSMAINQTLLGQYNQLVSKYSTLRPDFTALVSPIIGYSNLITAYYQTIDFAMYLQSEMLPTVTISQINADTEIVKLTANAISPVAVTSISNLSLATANNAVLSVAKCLINPNYQIKISSSSLSETTWSGVFYIENYSDEDDNATSESISITINSDYSNYVNQKIQKVLSQSKQDKMDIVDLFDMSLSDFTNELTKYNLDSLNNLQSICQSCIDVMIEQGIAVNQSWNGTNLYNDLYMNYYNKLSAINNEQAVRENEVNIIIGKYNNDKLISQGIQTILNKHRTTIQTALNFENYLGSDLWLEFCAYKRESKYSNSNYISDGLNNAELFEKALEFIEKAKKELYTSAELQHSISASLKNLLVIPKFKILTQYFKVGNWLRILIDDNVYKLRLINYEIDYSNLEDISVEFSDILSTADGYTDEQSLMQKMSNMITSYDYTQHQAEQGSKTHTTVNDWVRKGLNVTNNKIIQGTSNQTQTWDEHGMLFRQFDYETDDYDDCQLKIINSTLAVTDDNWLTVKTAVGKHYYIDPTTNQVTYAFGTNAETIVGKMILGEQLGIYNSAGSLTFNHNGFNITNSKNSFNVNPNATNLLTISKTVDNTTESIFYVDNNGTLHIKGDGSALDITANSSITGATSRITQTENDITAIVSRNGSGTIVSLDAEKVKVAWNGVSTSVQFDFVSSRAGISIYNSSSNRVLRLDNAGLKINNSSGSTLMDLYTNGLNLYDENEKLLMRLNSRGTNYYLGEEIINNTSVNRNLGYVGTGSWGTNNLGIVFRLNYVQSENPTENRYMCWSYQETANGTYDVKMYYIANNFDNNLKGMHFVSDNVYFESPVYLKAHTYLDNGKYFYLNDNVYLMKYSDGSAGLRSFTHNVFVTGNTATLGSVFLDNNNDIINNKYIKVTDSIINCKGDIDMQSSYHVINESDIRLKTNIESTNINALDLINQIEMKSFDWIENNEHEDIGFIAQQLQEIIPDLIYEDSTTTKLSIKTTKFIPYIIKAIQEISEKLHLINGNFNNKNKFMGNKVYQSIKLSDKQSFIQQIRMDDDKPKEDERALFIPKTIKIKP